MTDWLKTQEGPRARRAEIIATATFAQTGGSDGDQQPAQPTDFPRGRVWSANAEAKIIALETKLAEIRARSLPTRVPSDTQTATETRTESESKAIADGVEEMLCKARQAASGIKLRSRAIWWSGTAVEATFKNLHSAEAAIARLFTENEIRAEIPEAVARAAAVLDRDDPRRAAALSLFQCVGVGADKVRRCDAEILSRIIQIGHDAADQQRAKLRLFRNIILLGALVTLLVMVAFIVIVAEAPAAVPLCFNPEASRMNQNSEFVCPTRNEGGPSGGDAPIVALIGLLGGALSGVAFVGNLKSNSTPYNISVPLALLKIPAGALTAVAAVIVLAGDFVPGFSAVDSQAQILAYALIFGFAQQLFTRLLDQRAQDLASNIPSKASIDEPRRATNWPEIDLTSADADDTASSDKGR